MFRISQDPLSGSNEKQYLTEITYNCSTVRVMRCQYLAAYLTCIVCVYCNISNPCSVTANLQPVLYTHTVQVKYAAKH
jgi:hypothetical protein